MGDFIGLFPDQILKAVFQHLDETDFLTASLVKQSWYEYIAQTSICMKKIKLRLCTRELTELTPKSVSLIRDSMRLYENIEFRCYSIAIPIVKEILEAPGRRWKSVMLSRLNFNSTEDCMDFMSVFESTVEELRLDKVYIDSIYCDKDNTMEFPNLNILDAKYIQTLIYYKVLSNCKNLTELRITSGDQSVSSMAAIHKMLMNNKSLKKLSIVTNVFNQYFNEDFSMNIKFKLISLEARDIYNLSPTHKENFQHFLQTQMQTIETLDLGDWMGLDVVKMIFHMPRLKSFTFKGFYNIEENIHWETIQFQRNQSIESLHLIELKGQREILEAFINAMPNIKHLYLYTIHNESLAFLSKALPNLESLKLDLFEATNIEANSFIKLLKFSAKVFTRDFKCKAITDQLGHFERLVVEQVEKIKTEDSEPIHKHFGRSNF